MTPTPSHVRTPTVPCFQHSSPPPHLSSSCPSLHPLLSLPSPAVSHKAGLHALLGHTCAPAPRTLEPSPRNRPHSESLSSLRTRSPGVEGHQQQQQTGQSQAPGTPFPPRHWQHVTHSSRFHHAGHGISEGARRRPLPAEFHFGDCGWSRNSPAPGSPAPPRRAGIFRVFQQGVFLWLWSTARSLNPSRSGTSQTAHPVAAGASASFSSPPRPPPPTGGRAEVAGFPWGFIVSRNPNLPTPDRGALRKSLRER